MTVTASSDSYHDCPQSPLSQKLPSPRLSPSKHVSLAPGTPTLQQVPGTVWATQEVSEAHEAMGLSILSVTPA